MFKPYTRTLKDRTEIYKSLHPMFTRVLDKCLQKYLHDIYTTSESSKPLLHYIQNQELVHIVIYLGQLYLYIPSYKYKRMFSSNTINGKVSFSDNFKNSQEFEFARDNTQVTYITILCNTLEEVLYSMGIQTYTHVHFNPIYHTSAHYNIII